MKCSSHRNKAFVSLLEDTLGINAEAQNGSKILHIIAGKVNKLIVCPQMIAMLRYTK